MWAIALFLVLCHNDNFEGVATLFNRQIKNYKVATARATVTTFAGSIFLAETLLKNFFDKRLVFTAIANTNESHLAFLQV